MLFLPPTHVIAKGIIIWNKITSKVVSSPPKWQKWDSLLHWHKSVANCNESVICFFMIIARNMLTWIADPRWRFILREWNETILVPIMNIHISASPVHDLLLRRLHIPFSQFTLSHKPIGWRNINLWKQRYQPAKSTNKALSLQKCICNK